MSEQFPQSFTVHLPNGIPLIVPSQMVDAVRQYWQSEPDVLVAVITARPSQMSRELEAKVNAKLFRCFRILMKDGTSFHVRFPGSVDYWCNTFMVMARTAPKAIYLTSNIDRIEDLGPAGINWTKAREESKQIK